jgi:hypothetical protein
MTLDMCFFKNNRLLALIILYVDDLLVAALDLQTIREIRHILTSYYKLKEFREVQEFLGIAVVQH